MGIRLQGGRVYDPAQRWNGEVRDLFVRDGRLAADPGPDTHFDADYDLSGKIVMAGTIDIHIHSQFTVNDAAFERPEGRRFVVHGGG